MRQFSRRSRLKIRGTAGLGVDFLATLGGPFFGEVQIGELAEELDGFAVVGAGGLDLVA